VLAINYRESPIPYDGEKKSEMLLLSICRTPYHLNRPLSTLGRMQAIQPYILQGSGSAPLLWRKGWLRRVTLGVSDVLPLDPRGNAVAFVTSAFGRF
jgi:hypothetical protein